MHRSIAPAIARVTAPVTTRATARATRPAFFLCALFLAALASAGEAEAQ